MPEQSEFDPLTVPVRPAATVMLVRDNDGLEVFMLRRTMDAVFAGGMYVFPGGRVDVADGAPELEDICAGRSDHDASGLLQIPSGGLAYWVAAIRECFEEAGVLLARASDSDDYIRFGDDKDVIDRFEGYRRAIHRGELSLRELCHREELELAADAMEYVAHWITPVGERRRFDTRFLVARVPDHQEPLHDDHETIDSLWVRPDEALARNAAGELGMLPPTVANLHFLAEHPTAAAVMSAAARVGVPPTILPKVRVDAEGRVLDVVLPGQPAYDDLP
jgi:8-oxo-dGTP pyrophosphatase MutT (NUDIX family)